VPGLLKSIPVDDELRLANDRHRPLVVLAVLGVLAVYVYLFTQAAGSMGLRLPAELAWDLGVELPEVFDDDGNVESNLQISMTDRFERSDDERLVFFATVAAAFLCAYFLPLRYKQASLVLWATVALLLLYGLEATSALVLAHLVVYLVLHPDSRRGLPIGAGAGLAAYLAFLHEPGAGVERWIWIGILPAVCAAGYRYALLPLLGRPRFAAIAQPAVVHSAILTICVGILAEARSGAAWQLPLGLLMFFWQWARITMYYIDHRDGLIPHDVPLHRYLAVFLSPGAIPNWNWGVTIPQGYAYLNNSFLSRDKNDIVLGGLRLLGIALLYLVCWDWLRNGVSQWLEALGIPVYRCNTRFLVRHFVSGADVGTASVLLTTLLDLARFMLFFGSVMHFKVGVWRLFGYDVAAYYDRPWKATNLVALWGRFAFHYREFLVRAFYYPSFFLLFRGYPRLRVFVASMMAATVGNFIWHVSERAFFRELSVDDLLHTVGTWPYFVLLGLGIGSYQLFRMLRKPTRRPWTRDRWIAGDVLAAYCTLQFFGLIHIFMRPASGGSTADLFRLFLIGFGIELPR
jgi:hypothetical protein